MNAIYEETVEKDGWKAVIKTYYDEDIGPPWKEHDGHGPVSDWTSRDKRAGERVLSDDRGCRLYYDFQEAVRIAKRDGWGCKGSEGLTPGQIAAKAAEADFEYLRRWCNNDWHWVGYNTCFFGPDGEEHERDSCWGFDDHDWMLDEARETALLTIEILKETENQTAIAACWP